MAYQPLDIDRQEIRLVTLEPGEGPDNFKCNLHVVSLLENPIYEALSYTWGDERVTTTISLDNESFNATVNLAIALQHLRRADQQRVIWIDALCINQKDILERNAQVTIMGDIYRHAHEVIAWLGPAGEDGYPAFDLFLTISAESQHTENGKHWGPASNPGTTSVNLRAEELKAVISLLARSWWRRMWTVQELLLAKKLTFMCGNRQLPAEDMFATSDSYYAHVESCCEPYFRSTFEEGLMMEFNESMSTIDRLGIVRGSHITLQKALFFFRQRECKDPRDMIYGLIGLASDLTKGDLTPDYSSPVSKIYTDATTLLIQKSQSLGIFSQLYHPSKSQLESEPDRVTLNLPSWVADWSTSWSDKYISEHMIRQSIQDRHFRTGGKAGYTFFARNNHTAICKGLIVGKIKTLSEPRGDSFHVLTLASWQDSMDIAEKVNTPYRSWKLDNEPCAGYWYGGNLWLDAFYRTISSSTIPSTVEGQAVTTRVSAMSRPIFNAVSQIAVLG